ncbi:hypothetical protein [Nocardia sp. BMG51109]|uniref:hypothetical protein n=1 Tax=Nocardia sp. BMG51109 TaxID=1056816 RepID=UPI0012EBE011|nr:hypothetical protein [Nocardia sp. BMG51109]
MKGRESARPDGRISGFGVELELALRPMAGPLVGGRNLSRPMAAAMQLPALVLIVALLVVPAVATVVLAAGRGDGRAIVAWCAVVVVAGALLTRLWRSRRSPAGSSGSWAVPAGPRSKVRYVAEWPGEPHREFAGSIVLLVVPFAGVAAAGPRHGESLPYWSLFLTAALCVVWWGRGGRDPWTVSKAAVIPAAALVTAGAAIVSTLGGDGARAYAFTLGWVVAATLILLIALLSAWKTRRAWWPWWPLILSFAVSPFVAGLAFRLLFEPIVYPAESVLLQVVLYLVMLVVAFVWTWSGALFVLLRSAADAVESDPVRKRHLGPHPRWPSRRSDPKGTSWSRVCREWWQWIERLVDLLNPVLLMLWLVVAVAAARVFDVVLIAVPGSQQYALDTSTVYWWHLTIDGPANRAAAAVYSIPLAVVVGLGAWLLQTGVRRHGTRWSAPAARAIPVHLALRSGPASGRWGLPGARPARLRIIGPGLRAGLLPILMLAPLIALIVASWAGPDGSAFTGPRSVWQDTELWHALLTAAWVAIVATCLTVTAALPPAFYAATLDPRGVRSRLAVAALVVLAAMPVQVYIGPIRAFIEDNSLAGTSMPLILTHSAIGLPIAILILRGALLAPEDSPIADVGRGLIPTSIAARYVLGTAGPAVGAVAVLEMVQIWNDFFIGQQVGGADASPWSLLLWSEARAFHDNMAHLAAGALLAAIPPVVLVLLTWRRLLVPGLTGGELR